MKRINPNTGVPFKRGDLREDGFHFREYKLTKLKKDGFFAEVWSSENKTTARKYTKHNKTNAQYTTLEGYLLRRYWETKHRAKTKNIPFDLSPEYLLSIFPTNCPVFGFELNWQERTGAIKFNSPSLDRIDPKLGYVVGNVQYLSKLANSMKQDATTEQLECFARWVLDK